MCPRARAALLTRVKTAWVAARTPFFLSSGRPSSAGSAKPGHELCRSEKRIGRPGRGPLLSLADAPGESTRRCVQKSQPTLPPGWLFRPLAAHTASGISPLLPTFGDYRGLRPARVTIPTRRMLLVLSVKPHPIAMRLPKEALVGGGQWPITICL
jgi:hypothetical protein